MTVILAVVAFVVGVVAGTRVIKLAVKCTNSLFDKIEEKI